uniref:Uncharacterized protein n=1 Tax=Schistosoma mansoni TaxID=6183 RepID=A0AA82N4D5_SCHMA
MSEFSYCSTGSRTSTSTSTRWKVSLLFRCMPSMSSVLWMSWMSRWRLLWWMLQ